MSGHTLFSCWILALNLDVTLNWTFVKICWPHCPRAWMITVEISHIASSDHTGDVTALLNPQSVWTQCDEGLCASVCGLRKWLSLAQLFCGLLFSCCFHFSPSLTPSTRRASDVIKLLDRSNCNQQSCLCFVSNIIWSLSTAFWKAKQMISFL